MKLDIQVERRSLPRLLKKNGEKLYLQTIRVVQNKALAEARKFAAKTIRDRYSLPRKPESGPFAKPSIKEVLTTSLVTRIGGIQAGIPSRLFANNKRIGAMRFVEASQRKPIEQKGIPVKNRKPLKLNIGKKIIVSRRRFVQRGNSKSGMLHVFRSKKAGRKWTMSRSSLSSVYRILMHDRIQKKLEMRAHRKFSEAFSSEFRKRIMKL